VLDARPDDVADLPLAEIDGSSYGLSAEHACEVYLQPRKVFPDPFRGGDHILVLCDTHVPPATGAGARESWAAGAHCGGSDAGFDEEAWAALQPHATNFRAACDSVMRQADYQAPEVALQQEYSLCSSHSRGAFEHACAPLSAAAAAPACGGLAAAMAIHGGLRPGACWRCRVAAAARAARVLPAAASVCWCRQAARSMPCLTDTPPALPTHHIQHTTTGLSAKACARLGRDVSELHMQACTAAGLSFGGRVHVAAPANQWAYKIGPCGGLEAADQLCISRFLLGRVAEQLGARVLYDAASGGDDDYASGGVRAAAAANKCVIAFSTATTRDPVSGLYGVQVLMERLRASHEQFAARCLLAGSPAMKAADSARPAAPPLANSSSWHSALEAFGLAAAAPAARSSSAASAASSPRSRTSNGSAASSGSAVPAGANVGVGSKHASIMVPSSTLINGCGAILDRRSPGGADPYLATLLLAAAACGVALPQGSAAPVAGGGGGTKHAEPAAGGAAAPAAGGASARAARPVAIPGAAAGKGGRPGRDALLGGGSSGARGSLLGASTFGGGPGRATRGSSGESDWRGLDDGDGSFGSSMLLSGSGDSHEMLLSVLDRLDGHGGFGHGGTAAAALARGGGRGLKRGHLSDDGDDAADGHGAQRCGGSDDAGAEDDEEGEAEVCSGARGAARAAAL
jgi:glutamine synthetase